MNGDEGARPTLPETISLESAKLWLPPLILGTLVLTLVFLVALPFWSMAPFDLIAATLVVVVLGIIWYMRRWRRRRDLTCAPDGLHITGVGREHVVAWADITGAEIGRNLHYQGSENFSVLVNLTGGRTVRQLSNFTFSEVAAAEHARRTILTWQAAYACPAAGATAWPRPVGAMTPRADPRTQTTCAPRPGPATRGSAR